MYQTARRNTLLWMVYDNYDLPRIDDNGTFKYIDQLGSDGNRVNGAKLRVDGGAYLDIYDSDGERLLPYAVLTLDRNALGEFVEAGPVWSDFGEYADPAHVFTVELGHWDWENGEWSVLATSQAAAYAALVAGGWTSSSSVIVPREGPWTPTFEVASVPEPTGGVLMLVGTALLALRRRRVARA